jgi:hypothetical protein
MTHYNMNNKRLIRKQVLLSPTEAKEVEAAEPFLPMALGPYMRHLILEKVREINKAQKAISKQVFKEQFKRRADAEAYCLAA